MPVPVPPLFYKGHAMGTMAGTNELAFFFAVEADVPGRVQDQAAKKIEKCLLAGAGTKNCFSKESRDFTWPQLGPFFVPACPPLTAINGY